MRARQFVVRFVNQGSECSSRRVPTDGPEVDATREGGFVNPARARPLGARASSRARAFVNEGCGSRRWNGEDGGTKLMEQAYGSPSEWAAHFDWLARNPSPS